MIARHTRRWRLAAVLAACAALLLATASARPQSRRAPGTIPAPDPPALRVPFRVGEKLEYLGGWQFYNGGATLRLAAVEQRVFSGQNAWHFQAQATTLNPLRYIFILDDQFDSYSESTGIASVQYEQYIREQNKRENRIFRMSHEGEPAGANGAVVVVPKGTRDPLSALYFLRSVDWARTPVVTMPVFDGKKLYEIRARRALTMERVEVPAGNYSVSRVTVRVYERGRELTNVRVAILLANDTARTPVLIEAELPFGSVRAELSSVQGQ